MSSHSSRPTITLPALIAYSDALLTSLLAEGQKQETDTVTQTAEKLSSPLLWVVADNYQTENLNQQLNQQGINIKGNSQNLSKANSENTIANDTKRPIEISTLAQLNKQNARLRYQLGCFWLPTLKEEQLQPFIPLIMRYRDLYAAHLLIAVNADINLRAYGFTPFDIMSEHPLESAVALADDAAVANPRLTLWQFNLYDYKRLPNWLNNKYWANPENWDKHRW